MADDNANVMIGTQQFISLDIVLEVGSIEENITVSGNSPLIETSNASQGGTLDTTDFKELPSEGRSVFMLAALIYLYVKGHDYSIAALQDVVIRNRDAGKGGVYAVCSAHPWVIDAAIQQAIEDDSVLLVESTSSQVNQLGGYTGQTPAQFAEFIHSAARRSGFPSDRILLGGDHLGLRTAPADSQCVSADPFVPHQWQRRAAA